MAHDSKHSYTKLILHGKPYVSYKKCCDNQIYCPSLQMNFPQ